MCAYSGLPHIGMLALCLPYPLSLAPTMTSLAWAEQYAVYPLMWKLRGAVNVSSVVLYPSNTDCLRPSLAVQALCTLVCVPCTVRVPGLYLSDFLGEVHVLYALFSDGFVCWVLVCCEYRMQVSQPTCGHFSQPFPIRVVCFNCPFAAIFPQSVCIPLLGIDIIVWVRFMHGYRA